MKCPKCHNDVPEIKKLQGMCNLLSDKLGRYTGYPASTELALAKRAVKNNMEFYNVTLCQYGASDETEMS